MKATGKTRAWWFRFEMINVYLETSAVNYFLNLLTGVDAQATHEYQISKGREWYISTTVLWELMQIKNFKDYDACLFLSTFLFHSKLLKSAPEIVIDYFEQGCPSYQVLKDPFTACSVGNHWEKACADRSYSFNLIGSAFIELTDKYKVISRYMTYLYDTEVKVPQSAPDIINSLRKVVDELYGTFFSDSVSKQIISLRRIALILLFIQVCCGIDLAQDAIIAFWEKKGVLDPIERFHFILDSQPDILQSGPLWNMANTVLLQSWNKKTTSRGALHDGLHSIYLPFVDVFLTKDDHFRSLRDKANKQHFELFYKKILHLDEVKLTSTRWEVKPPLF